MAQNKSHSEAGLSHYCDNNGIYVFQMIYQACNSGAYELRFASMVETIQNSVYVKARFCYKCMLHPLNKIYFVF